MTGARGLFGSRAFLLSLLIFLGLGGAPAAQSFRQVDLELILAVDCSYSVDTAEFDLQKIGLAEAFRHPAIVAALRAGKYGAIRVAMVEWSGTDSQVVVVPWTTVHDAASAAALAAKIDSAPRLTQEGATSISSMIEFGLMLFAANRSADTRRVIDISADGRNNTGARITVMRAYAAATGVTVNGLAILNEVPTLDFYFHKYVIAGSDAFVIRADDYSHYALAILRKLLREISIPPVS